MKQRTFKKIGEGNMRGLIIVIILPVFLMSLLLPVFAATQTAEIIPTPPPYVPSGNRSRDTTPPVISNVTVAFDSSITISWDTNEISDSTVKIWKESTLYTIEKSDPNFVLFHSIQLERIQEYATYYFVVNSIDLNGNLAQSSEYIFVLTPPSNEEAVEKSSPAFPSKEAAVEKKGSPFNRYLILDWWTVLIAVLAAIIISAMIIKGKK